MSARHLTDQLPLAGAIVCWTSIPAEQRSALGAIATEMGATIKLDLTSDVTHLIVANIDSEKYRYVARLREDVKVLAPEWLDALRQVWMKGGDVDVAALEEEYRLPTFYGLKICLTGFDDPEQRKYIQEKTVENGAEYSGDLTKGVTHLIAAHPTGKKYEYALAWNMKIVSFEWFEQSLQRGMALAETYYDPRKPVEERGEGAWVRRNSMSPTLGKRSREPGDAAALNPLKRKLRRSASSKLGSQSEALWAGITAVGLDRRSFGDDDWTEGESANTIFPNESASGKDNTVAPEEAASENLTSHTPSLDADTGIFQGRAILTYGFDSDKTRILREHMTSNGASVVQSPADVLTLSSDALTRGYLVVPHDGVPDLDSLPGRAGMLTRATNWWVERCLHGKSLVDPAAHVLCRPLKVLSIPGFEDLAVNATGFSGIEFLHVTKVVSLIGGTYNEFLTAKTSVVVCNGEKPNEKKAKFIADKKIPAVNAAWLWDCLSAGELLPYDDYLLRLSPAPRASTDREQAPFPEVPTVRLSEEELRQRKAQTRKVPQRPTSRNGPQKPRALPLSFSTNPTPTPSATHPNTASARERDGEGSAIPAIDGPASEPPAPPEDIHEHRTAHRRSSTASTSETAPAREKEPTPDSIIPPAEEPKKDYSTILSDILAQRRAAAQQQQQQQQVGGPDANRRKRQLGRAPSAPSHASTAEDVGLGSRRSSVGPEAEHKSRRHPHPGIDGEEEEEEEEGRHAYQYQPSQVLGWDAPGAQEARERMIKAMGGRVEVEAEGRASVAARVGVMRDLVGESGGGGRAGRRRRV